MAWIEIPESVDQRLTELAARRGTTREQVLRELIPLHADPPARSCAAPRSLGQGSDDLPAPRR
jgi:hypothetical protein